jgi:hypothetical protein
LFCFGAAGLTGVAFGVGLGGALSNVVDFIGFRVGFGVDAGSK